MISKTYLPYDLDQQLLLPASLREWLPEDHLACFISDLVDQSVWFSGRDACFQTAVPTPLLANGETPA